MGKNTAVKIKETKLYKLGFDNRFILLSFLCSVAIMLLVLYCYGAAPFGDVTILRMDLYHQYGPLFAELYDRLAGGGSLLYSWNSGGGSSFLGNFYNYLSSPLSLIILLFGHINMTDAIACLILLKAAFASTAFTYYLKKSTSIQKHDYATAAFGILYAFSGYFIAYYWNVMWLDAMVFFPIVILGIERIIDSGKISTYCLGLTLTIFSNYYMSYMVCLFSVLYAVAYYFGQYDLHSRYTEPAVKKDKLYKKVKNSKLLMSAGRFIFASLLSVLLCAFSLIPIYYILQACSATSGTFPTNFSTYFNIFDFLANHLASLTPTIRSSGDDVLPNIYCGMATLLLASLYLFTKSIPTREKVANVFLLLFIFLSFNINFLNYIWHGLHFPNDLPYRFSFMYSFILLVIAYKTLLRIREFTSKEILGAGMALLAFIVLAEKIGSKNVVQATVMISIIFVIIYVVVLNLMRNKKFQASAVATLLLCCVISEIAVANTNNYSMDQTKTDYTSDYNDFQTLKSDLDKYDGTDFYRMELSYLRTRMDPSWYNYNGVSTFSSMAYEKLSNTQSNLGMYGNFINSYTYFPQTPVYNAMFSLKYIVHNSDISSINNSDLYTKLMSTGKYTAYKNNYWLPIAYCTDNNILSWASSGDNPFEIQSNYFYKATGISDVLTQLPVSDVEYYNINDFGDHMQTGNLVFYKTTAGQTASVTLNIIPQKTQNVYVYIKSSNVTQVNYRTDKGYYVTQDTETPYIYDLGLQEADTVISIDIPIATGDSGYIQFYAYGLDQKKFEEGYSILKQSSLNVKEFDDTNISGTVTADKDCVLYTSIPYDPGWSVKVDGVKVSSDKLVALGGSLLGVKIAKGTHTVEFSYSPKGMTAGIVISLITLLLIILYTVYKRVIKGKNQTLEEEIETALLIDENSTPETAESQDLKKSETENQ